MMALRTLLGWSPLLGASLATTLASESVEPTMKLLENGAGVTVAVVFYVIWRKEVAAKKEETQALQTKCDQICKMAEEARNRAWKRTDEFRQELDELRKKYAEQLAHCAGCAGNYLRLRDEKGVKGLS